MLIRSKSLPKLKVTASAKAEPAQIAYGISTVHSKVGINRTISTCNFNSRVIRTTTDYDYSQPYQNQSDSNRTAHANMATVSINNYSSSALPKGPGQTQDNHSNFERGE